MNLYTPNLKTRRAAEAEGESQGGRTKLSRSIEVSVLRLAGSEDVVELVGREDVVQIGREGERPASNRKR